jgi:outer membrane immunogenic protein
MKKNLLASMALAALMVSPAFAADLPRKAPPPPPPAPVYTWTGCYIGLNAGWVRAETRLVLDDSDFGEFSRSRSGGAFGGQIGCDYQFATNWVLGIRGLLDGTNIDFDRQSRFDNVAFHGELSRFATITARLGYAVTPAFLIYGQVGWGVYKTNLIAFDPTNDNLWWGHASRKNSGLDVGVGGEWMFAPNWSLWIEWDHIFARDQDVFFDRLSDRLEVTGRVRRDLDKVLIGVNWRFGGFGGGPLRAAY